MDWQPGRLTVDGAMLLRCWLSDDYVRAQGKLPEAVSWLLKRTVAENEVIVGVG